MSKLRDDFNKILLQAFGQIELMRKKYPDDEHATVGEDFYAGRLMDKVREHIRKCEKPKNIYGNPDDLPKTTYGMLCMNAFAEGVGEDRKELQESL